MGILVNELSDLRIVSHRDDGCGWRFLTWMLGPVPSVVLSLPSFVLLGCVGVDFKNHVGQIEVLEETHGI